MSKVKLVVELDDQDYKFIQDLQILRLGSRAGYKTIQQNVINAIKNGMIYDDSGDLVSRDALMYEIRRYTTPFSERSDEFSRGATECACEVLDTIDTAPAIVPHKSDEKPTKDLITEILGFDVSEIEPLPGYRDEGE